MTTTTTDQNTPLDAKCAGFIAVTLTKQGGPIAVQFATMTELYAWEDANPEVEVVSTMTVVSTNYAEQVAR